MDLIGGDTVEVGQIQQQERINGRCAHSTGDHLVDIEIALYSIDAGATVDERGEVTLASLKPIETGEMEGGHQ